MQSSSPNPHVSLFPFLTVLLATMGILVVMLVLVVRATSLRSQATGHDQAEVVTAELDKLRDDLDLHHLRREALLAARPELIEQLQAARLARANVQTALDDLQRETEVVAAQLELARGAQTGAELPSASARQRQRQEWSDRIAAAQARLDDAQQRRQTEPRKLYSIVPTQHANSTNRRPIYVECVADGLVLQPFGILLRTYEMPVPGLPGNPLDAALSTIREYWLRYGAEASGGQPYPLLVVRPAGAGTYGLARRALGSWADEFGYELVEQDLPLDFGTVDQQLYNAVVTAVERAKREQIAHTRLLEEISRQQTAQREMSRVDLGQGLQADRVNGGFIRTDGGSAGPTRSVSGTFDPQATTHNQQAALHNPPRGAESGAPLTPSDSEPREASGGARTQSKSLESGGSAYVSSTSLEPLAKQRGANWGISHASGVSYRRPVRVLCATDHLMILGGRLSVVEPQRIEFDGDVFAAIEPLTAHCEKLIRSWGPPPPDGHWRPELRVTVIGDAQATAERLSQLLRGSGLEWMGDTP